MPLAAPVTAAAAPRIAVMSAPGREMLREPLYGGPALATGAGRGRFHNRRRRDISASHVARLPADLPDRGRFARHRRALHAGGGADQGSRASVAAAFGCTLGILPHMAAAMLGLAAVLHASALAFSTLKWCGVLYLLYMAWQSCAKKARSLSIQVERDRRGG